MSRHLLASAMALSLAFSGLASPAIAGQDRDLERFIAGAITLFIIGKALEGRKARAEVARRRTPPPADPPAFRGFLPGECFFSLPGAGGRRGVYGETCLKELMLRPQSLPLTCRQTVPVKYGRPAKVYDAACLRRKGFRETRWRP